MHARLKKGAGRISREIQKSIALAGSLFFAGKRHHANLRYVGNRFNTRDKQYEEININKSLFTIIPTYHTYYTF